MLRRMESHRYAADVYVSSMLLFIPRPPSDIHPSCSLFRDMALRHSMGWRLFSLFHVGGVKKNSFLSFYINLLFGINNLIVDWEDEPTPKPSTYEADRVFRCFLTI
jgi:hypothetical protein